MSNLLKSTIFTDETKAREHLEALRWANGRFCPHCGEAERTAPVGGVKHRPGLYYCNGCNGQFTVTVGTVFERSKIPLTKWWLATYLLCSSKKGMSSHQLHRTLGVTYKTAWFMTHRIREAMKSGSLIGPLGGTGKTVEADETYYGKKKVQPTVTTSGRPFTKGGAGVSGKRAIVSLVERKGAVRSFHVKDHPTIVDVSAILKEHASKKSALMTDESKLYTETGKGYASHETVQHSAKEYVRGDAHTNTIEGYFSIFKRGMVGVYQHCGEQHLHRYLAEFDFRYSNRVALGIDDAARTVNALKGIENKRLTYRRTGQRPNV